MRTRKGKNSEENTNIQNSDLCQKENASAAENSGEENVDEQKSGLAQKIKRGAAKVVSFAANPRLLLCFGIGWLITNGWSYILMGIGTYYDIGWMIAVSGAYLAFLWLPFTPEKIVTLIIAMWLLKRLFPRDQRTLAVLHEWHLKAKESVKRKKADRKQKQKDK